MKKGADHYMSKPSDVDQILAAYENLQSTASDAMKASESVPSLARVEWEHMQRVIADCEGIHPKRRGCWAFIAGPCRES